MITRIFLDALEIACLAIFACGVFILAMGV